MSNTTTTATTTGCQGYASTVSAQAQTNPFASVNSGMGGGGGYYTTGNITVGTVSASKITSGIAGNINNQGGTTGWTGGQWYTINGSGAASQTNPPGTSNYKPAVLTTGGGIRMTGDDPYIELDDGRRINLGLLADMMEKMQNVLCVVKAHMEQLDEYPALQAAYEEYKLVEAIIRPDDDDLKAR